jgi:hypothetical protein
MQQDRRLHSRARVIYGGTIAFNHRQSSMDCKVQNFSEAGAKVAFDQPALLPERIDLVVDRKGRAYSAEIVWCTERAAGLRFVDAPANEAAPVPLDWARRLRECENDRKALQARLKQLTCEH